MNHPAPTDSLTTQPNQQDASLALAGQAGDYPCEDPVIADSEAQVRRSQPQNNDLSIFSSTFLTVFLAEIGDKTQITTLLMSAESSSPWIVFLGASIALIATSLIGVLVGRWLSTCLSPRTLEVTSGLVLLSITAMLVWDVVHS